MKRLNGFWRRDEGRVSMLIAVVVPALLFLVAAVVDGGGQVRALQRADNIAAQAARTAGQQIDYAQAVTGGAKVIDPRRAREAGEKYLESAGVKGTVEPSADLLTVRVTVQLTYQPIMLGAFGRGPVSVSGQSTAQLVTGN